jgi:hypothetical protein
MLFVLVDSLFLVSCKRVELLGDGVSQEEITREMARVKRPDTLA